MAKSRQWGVALLASSLLFAACGTSGSSSSKPVAGGTFHEGLVKLTTEDPATARTVSDRVYADQVYDGLTTWDPTSLTVRAKLAQKWESSPDKKSWTFHLRDNLKASNNEPVTSTDVKLSLEHVARKATNSPVVDLLSTVTGFAAFTGDPNVPSLSGITAVDPTTVRIDLDAPNADLPSLLGNPSFGIQHYGPAGTPVASTGDYTVTTKNDSGVSLKKRDGADGYLDLIDIKFFPDVQSSYDAFVKGSLDWTPIPQDKAKEAGDKYGTSLFKASLRTVYLAFNVNNPKLSDIRFREAIAKAIDRQKLAPALAPGDGKVIDSVVPSQVPGGQGNACGNRCAFDADAAKKQLAAVFSGTAPPAINVDITSPTPFSDAATKVFTANLADSGVTATLRPRASTDLGGITVAPDREMFQLSWTGAYPSAAAFLLPLFQSTSSSNVFGINNPQIDAALGKAASENDPSQRAVDYHDAERTIFDQLPLVPVAQFPVDSVAGSRVHGLDPLPTGNFEASKVWIQP